MNRRTALFVLVAMLLVGCSNPGTQVAKPTEDKVADATAAVDRMRRYRTRDTMVEADRLVEIASRDESIDHSRFSLLHLYFLTSSFEAEVGPEEGAKERADACGDELHGHGHPGECKRLWDEWAAHLGK
jgi:hypothetical protein